MDYYKINSDNPEQSVIKKTASVIKSGGIIVYPTDTLYGFGVNIFDHKAMDRLFYLKNRHAGKPISIMVNKLSQIEEIIGDFNKVEYEAATKFYPGKITLLFSQKIKNPIPRLSHLKKIGFRIPDSEFTRQLINEVGFPITTTSVNISTKENVKNVEEIVSIFGDKIDMIIDAGPVKSTMGSTVLDLTSDPPEILRKGDISRSEIVKILKRDVSTNYSGKFVITFVCSGNICRSPMAEGILKKMLAKTKFKNSITVNSAGTFNIAVRPVHINALVMSDKYNLHLDNHHSRHIQARNIREANMIFTLARDHYKYLRSHYPEFINKIFLLKQWKIPRNLTNPSIADPIGYDLDFFEETMYEIQKEIQRIFPYILNELRIYVRDNSIIL